MSEAKQVSLAEFMEREAGANVYALMPTIYSAVTTETASEAVVSAIQSIRGCCSRHTASILVMVDPEDTEAVAQAIIDASLSEVRLFDTKVDLDTAADGQYFKSAFYVFRGQPDPDRVAMLNSRIDPYLGGSQYVIQLYEAGNVGQEG